jgi:hypothetical protein
MGESRWVLNIPVAGSCEEGYEPWGSIKGGEFLDKLRDY